MSFNMLSFVLSQHLAANEGITDPARQNFYGLLGGVMGSSAVGLGVTLALANQEAEDTPPVVPAAALSITTPQVLPPATDNQGYNATLKATGGTPPYLWTLSGGALPKSGNIKLDPATGVIGGTPDAGGQDDGFYGLNIQVTDSAKAKPATQTRLFLLNIAGAAAALKQAPKLTITTPQALPAATNGTRYSVILQVTGGTPPYTWTLEGGALPASGNLNLDPAGLVYGIPDKADDGTYALIIKVSDSSAPAASQSGVFSLKVGA